LRDVTSKAIFSMSFAAPDDGWAVSTHHSHVSDVPSTATVLRWDGRAWAQAAVQPPFRAAAVWTIGPGRVWVIGGDGQAARGDGTRWEVMETGVDELRSIWGSGPDDIWADGCGGRLVHWNGKAWRRVKIDIPSSHRGICLALGGSGPADVWGVSQLDNVFHFDGRRWSRVSGKRVSFGALDVRAVWAARPDDVWFAGALSSSGSGMLVHYDGASFTATPVPALPVDRDRLDHRGRSETHLWSIWGRASNDIWAVGSGGTRVHFDGIAWSRVEPTANDRRAILAVAGTSTAVWFGAEHGGLSALARDAALVPHPGATAVVTDCNALPPPAAASWWLQGDAACPDHGVLDGAPPPKGKRVWCRTPFGIAHGPETSFLDGRISTQGTNVHGRRAGTWSTYWSSGLVSERSECNGKAHGRWRRWSDRQLVLDGVFAGDEPAGKVEQWDKRGKLLGAYDLSTGTGHFVWWAEEGAKSSEYDLVDGQKHGVWTSYWRDGTKSQEGRYERGVRTGVWTSWRPNGDRESVGAFRDDKPAGAWTYWDKDGKRSTAEHW
jgi:antitoxin component YwqK of YwqJK toxin-antitoxin module